MDLNAFKREIQSTLEHHQPRTDERGLKRRCSCNAYVSGSRVSDAIAQHQTEEIMRELQQRGLLAP